MARQQDQTVHTGNTVVLKVGGKEIGRAQGLDARRSFGTQPVHEIGSIMPKEHVYTQYDGSFSLERYFVRKQSLKDLGLSALGEDILYKGVIDVEVVDKQTGKTVRIYRGCTLQDTSETFRVGQISGENSNWVYLEAGDGTETSSTSSVANGGSGISGGISF
mgnify:CR=1 FL=1|jgi:virion protein 5